MTSHYAVAQVREVYDALEAVKEEGEAGETLNLLALVRRTQMKARLFIIKGGRSAFIKLVFAKNRLNGANADVPN